ncbi:MAG TPA: PBSX family phage terminase large subunit [Streptosporangiaceae bacterium]|jgi:PBSX family phage terminase large subunit
MPATRDGLLDSLPLSRKQIRSVVESAQVRTSIWTGAIRSGKTIASLIAFLIALAALPRRGSGLVVMVGRTLQTIERNLIEPMQDPRVFGPLARHVHHTPGAGTAVILGRVVHLIGANDVRAEGRLRGLTACLAYVDEATLLPAGFWSQLLGRLSEAPGRLIATTNPDNPAHWLRRDYILRAGELNLASWHFTLHDNPYLSAEYKRDIAAEHVGLWYRRFIAGEWVAAEGAIFDMWDPLRHVVKTLPAISRWIACGIDYGTTNPTAALLLGLGSDGRLYLADEWRYDSRAARRSLTDVEYSKRIRAWLAADGHPGAAGAVDPEYLIVDPSASSFIVQLYEDGAVPMAADNAVLDGIRTMAGLLATGRLRVHERCEGLISEIGGYAWDDDAAAKGEDKPVKIADHSCDAARYSLHTTAAMWRPDLTNTIEEVAA